MSERTSSAAAPLRPGRIGVTAIYLAFVAETARTLVLTTNRDLWPWYLGLHSVFIISFTAVLWRPALHAGLLHVYFALQSAIILGLLSLNPQLDFVTALFVLLCYRPRWSSPAGRAGSGSAYLSCSSADR